jgi:uncharacterized lipoprotein YddW (UPF0748 family)
MRRTTTVLLALTLAAVPLAGADGQERAGTDAENSAASDGEELRGFWVDAFNEGIYDREQVDELVADAQAANANALFVQVGRRFDCFCNDALYPRTDAFIDPAPYDPLRAVIEAAHAEGIEVHAWINATTLWNSATPPSSPDHAFNQHGPSAEGDDRWLNQREDGTELVGNNAFIDPAHPDAVRYVVDGVRSVVEAYDVDGVMFDYIRYPDYNTPGAFASDWGYTDVALERFHEATGRSDRPESTDEQWSDWRRDQVTNLVRQLYLGAYDADPSVRVSINAVTYAFGPQTYGSWEQTRPYAEVLQDWRGWMEEGIVDLNVAMNYKRNWMPDQAQMFSEWTEVIADWQYDRQAVNGTAIYLNDIDDTLAQIAETRTPTADGNTAVGWSGYSYASPTLDSTGQSSAVRDEARADLIAALTGEDGPFADEAAVPEMTWKTEPTTGHVAGDVVARDGAVADQVEVDLWQRGEVVATALTDGNGWFGFVDVEPGRYQVRVDRDAVRGKPLANVTVAAGELADADVRPVALR